MGTSGPDRSLVSPPSRRDVLRASAAALAGIGLGGGALASIGPADAQGLTALKVQYDWLMSNGQIGDVIAEKKGFFAEQGLSVSFVPGGPNAQTVPPVLTGQALVGQLSGTSQALMAYGAGRPVKMFACGYQYSPYAFISLPRAPIRIPSDFVGKTVAVQPTGRFILDLILAQHRIDPTKVRVVNMGHDMTALTTGQVDAVTGFITNTKAMQVIGPDRIVMTSESAGITNYANAYFTSSETYEAQKPVLARFIKAIAKGWGWAFQNRAEAIDILCDAYPNLDREIERATVDVVMEISFDRVTRTKGWGWFEAERIERQIKLFDSIKRFETRVPDIAGFATHDILDMTADARPRLG